MKFSSDYHFITEDDQLIQAEVNMKQSRKQIMLSGNRFWTENARLDNDPKQQDQKKWQ